MNFAQGHGPVGYDDASLPTGVSIKQALRFARDNYLGTSAISSTPLKLGELLADEYVIAGSPVVLRGVRFRLEDVLSSPRSVEFLFKCYQCQTRSSLDPQRPELLGLGLCKECEKVNAEKMSQWDTIKGDGKVAVVTGGRIKIGTAEKTVIFFLPCGCACIEHTFTSINIRLSDMSASAALWLHCGVRLSLPQRRSKALPR